MENSTQNKTQDHTIETWMPVSLFSKIETTIKLNPELQVKMNKVAKPGEKIEGHFKVEFRFRNAGKKTFHQRLVSLFIKAMQ